LPFLLQSLQLALESQRIHKHEVGIGDMSVPLVLGDSRACGLELMRFVDAGPAPETDRRQRVRVALSLPIRLFRGDDSRPFDTRTRNVSSEGFYCVVTEPFTAGERIRCILTLPSFHPVHRDDVITLDCRARVVRVEALVPPNFGIGCSIEGYQVVQVGANEKDNTIR
jgi:hypothetical protein